MTDMSLFTVQLRFSLGMYSGQRRYYVFQINKWRSRISTRSDLQ